MTMTMATWEKKREAWTTARNAAKVKKGAVSSVSIGDDLDKVYNASKKGYNSLLAAIAKIEKDVKTYQAKGGKAVVPVEGWLKKLGEDLDKLQKAAEADERMLTKFSQRYVWFNRIAVPGYPDSFDANEAIKLVRQDATGATTWTDAAKSVGLYRDMPDVLKHWTAAVESMKGLTLQLTLPGKDAEYATLQGLSAKYAKCLKLLKNVSQSTSADEHLERMKAVTGPMSDLDPVTIDFDKAVKSLMG